MFRSLVPLLLVSFSWSCQSAPLGEKTSLPIGDIDRYGVRILSAMKRADLDGDLKIKGGAEQWALIDQLTRELILISTELQIRQ